MAFVRLSAETSDVYFTVNFFFQAEDGIRDDLVTGVQTCALPIFSHNLKNGLGSIKTILQLKMESPELPESLRGETQVVLDEIGRLSSKLNQLLRFSRPVVRGGSVGGRCDAAAVIEEVAGVLRHEAERRGVALELQVSNRKSTRLNSSHQIISYPLFSLKKKKKTTPTHVN